MDTAATRVRTQLWFALASGTLFGLGLAVSQMVNPAKVIGFLDLAGNWDPTLAFVMIGALAVAIPGFRLTLKRPHPFVAPRFSLPAKKELEPRLIAGAAIFGVGWGLSGFCPGPAITALVTGQSLVVLFVASMLGGALLCKLLAERS